MPARVSLAFLKQTRYTPTTGPLHFLSLLPKILSPRCPHASVPYILQVFQYHFPNEIVSEHSAYTCKNSPAASKAFSLLYFSSYHLSPKVPSRDFTRSTGLIPGRESKRGGHCNPLQYSCLENPHRQRSPGGYSPWGYKESDTTERLSTAWRNRDWTC